MMKLGLIATTKKVRSLSRLRGRAGVGVSPRATLPEWREPPPGASRRPKSELRSSRPPQAGEVKRVRGQIDLTKNHHALPWDSMALKSMLTKLPLIGSPTR